MPISAKTLAKSFVVVPAYNEGKVISDVINALCDVFPNVVVVDDGSTDDTTTVLRSSRAVVVTHAVNVGQGAALQTGIAYALQRGAEYIVTFDADGQHRTEDALAALGEVETGQCDVACGSRFLGSTTKIPITRKLILKAAVFLSNLTSTTKLSDAHNGLRALNRKAAACLEISQNGMAHASQIITQLLERQMIIHEVPVHIDYTAYSLEKGQSSLNALNIIIDLLVGRLLK